MGRLYDVFTWADAGEMTLSQGPAWEGGAERGAAASRALQDNRDQFVGTMLYSHHQDGALRLELYAHKARKIVNLR